MIHRGARRSVRDRVHDVLRSRVIEPTLRLLRQGITPRALALSMASGGVIGVFPVLGTSTVICVALALALRLNQVAMQAMNWLVYPLQLALIVPFVEIGRGVSQRASPGLALAHIEATFAQGWWRAVMFLRDLLLDAVLGWGLVALPSGVLVYLVLHRVLRRVKARTMA